MTAPLDATCSPAAQALRAAFVAGEPVVVVTRFADGLPADVRAELTALGYRLRGHSSPPDQSIVGEALATRVLELCCGVKRERMIFRREPGGKPLVHIDNGAAWLTPGISVSHTDYTVMAATCAHGRIGVDVETAHRVPWRVAERVFDVDDRRALLELPPDAREHALTRLWTVAEACAKGAGLGLGLLLARFDRLGLEHHGFWRAFRWRTEVLDATTWYALATDGGEPGRCLPAAEVTLNWLRDPV